jgi:hypothetical protein
MLQIMQQIFTDLVANPLFPLMSVKKNPWAGHKNLIIRNGWCHARVTMAGAVHWRSLHIEADTEGHNLPIVLEALRAFKLQLARDSFSILQLTKSRRDSAPIGRILQAFEADSAGRVIEPKSMKAAISSLRLILRTVTHCENPDTLNSSILTADLLRDYQAAKIAAAKPLGPDAVERAETTSKSTIQQARSVFSEAARQGKNMRLLTLPELTEFLHFRASGSTLRQRAELDDVTLARLTEGVGELHTTSPARWLAACLCGNLGLRRGSARMARWDWVRLVRGKPVMHLLASAETSAKGNAYKVTIDPSVWQDMLALRQSDSPYIVPGETEADRDAVFDENVKWLRELGIDANKPNHELRKVFAQTMRDTHGAGAASDSLGHSDPKLLKAYTTRGSDKTVRVF